MSSLDFLGGEDLFGGYPTDKVTLKNKNGFLEFCHERKNCARHRRKSEEPRRTPSFFLDGVETLDEDSSASPVEQIGDRSSDATVESMPASPGITPRNGQVVQGHLHCRSDEVGMSHSVMPCMPLFILQPVFGSFPGSISAVMMCQSLQSHAGIGHEVAACPPGVLGHAKEAVIPARPQDATTQKDGTPQSAGDVVRSPLAQQAAALHGVRRTYHSGIWAAAGQDYQIQSQISVNFQGVHPVQGCWKFANAVDFQMPKMMHDLCKKLRSKIFQLAQGRAGKTAQQVHAENVCIEHIKRNIACQWKKQGSSQIAKVWREILEDEPKEFLLVPLTRMTTEASVELDTNPLLVPINPEMDTSPMRFRDGVAPWPSQDKTRPAYPAYSGGFGPRIIVQRKAHQAALSKMLAHEARLQKDLANHTLVTTVRMKPVLDAVFAHMKSQKVKLRWEDAVVLS